MFSLLFFVIAGEDECDNQRNSREANSVASQQDGFVRNQPHPVFDWSLERHLMIKLYEARNRAVNTHAYVMNRATGHILWSCNSLGYPIPATTQLTNPQVAVRVYQGGTTIAQAEPNGLYSPMDTSATWVMCVDDRGQVTPVYEEDHVHVFPFPMEEHEGHLTQVVGQASSLAIDPSRPR
jgi:hypothetical protein